MRYEENILRSVIDSLQTFLLVLNPNGTLRAINKFAKNLLGNDQVIGNPVWSVNWLGNGPATESLWQYACEMAAQGEGTDLVDEISLPGYEKEKINFLISPLKNDAGQVILLLAEARGLALRAAVGVEQNVFANGKSTSMDSPQESSALPMVAEQNHFNPSDVEIAAQRSDIWLLNSEDRFRLMVESIEDYAMFIVDLDGFITSWNRGAERLTGYSDIEAIGRHFSMLYPKDVLDRDHAIHELMMAQMNGRYEEEGIRMRKNGTQYCAQVIVWRIDNHEGKTVGYAKITRDVTAIKQAQQREAQLFESENRFRLMVESIDEYAMFMVDTKGVITSWNRGAERLTGYTESEALGRPFSILYPKNMLPEDHAIYELNMARIHGRHEEEGIRVRKDGSVYHAQVIVWPVEDKTGEIVSFAKITRDITLRKIAERALKDSEAKFRIMTDAMPQMVWSVLPDGQQDYVNQQWFHFTGMEETNDAGYSWLDLVHPDDKNQVSTTWQDSLNGGNNFEAQFRLRHVSGTYRWTLGRALPVKTEQDKIIRWMGTFTDIHEQKRAETALQESARRKDEYLAMLAHELRNPLAPIRNSTELLRRLGPTDETVIGGLEVIDRQVAHMTRLIDDLLDVARISRGKIELRRETFELGELIRQTANDFSAGYKYKKVALQVNIPEKPMWLFADPTRIAQAMGNLLHNALKFTEAQGEVCISLTEETRNGKNFAVIKVKDTGMGIAPQLLEQLFEPFVQGDQDLARSKGGLGLGLALIKGFAILHGGTVQANSAGPGCGSEFIFCVPLATGLAPGRDATVTIATVAPLKVVLIDDNQDMVETLAALLSLDGHKVKCAYDGEAGLQLIRSAKPDLVFCDIGLPGALDGYAVARSVREDATMDKIFLVALSGYGQDKDKKLAFNSGFNDHLLKPVDFKGLTAMINAAGRSRSGLPDH
jgi:PAS domain S-box-containing protein